MSDRVVPRALACAAVVGVVVAFVWALTRPAEIIVGSNHVTPASFVLESLRPGQKVCDQLGYASRPADAVRLTVGTYEAPAQPLTLTVDGATSSLRSYKQGVVDVPLPAGHARGGDEACLRNDGTRRIAVAGVPGLAPAGKVDGKDINGKISFALADHDPPSWGARMADVIDHIGRATGAPLGGVTGYLLLVLFSGLLGVLGLSVARWAR